MQVQAENVLTECEILRTSYMECIWEVVRQGLVSITTERVHPFSLSFLSFLSSFSLCCNSQVYTPKKVLGSKDAALEKFNISLTDMWTPRPSLTHNPAGGRIPLGHENRRPELISEY